MKRKNLLALLLGFVLLLSACTAARQTLPQSLGSPLTGPSQTTETTNPTETAETTESPEIALGANVFFNDQNSFYEAGLVSVRPRHVYWDGDILVAQCFVINGLDVPVSNIFVQELRLSNENGVIAQGQFNRLDQVRLGVHEHTVWYFKFSADAITQPGCDLSTLEYYSRVSFDKETPIPTTPPATTAPLTTEPPVTTEAAPVNEYVSTDRPYKKGKVVMQPHHVYWEGDTLVIQCIFINCTQETIDSILVTDFNLYNTQGAVAKTRGRHDGVYLPPGEQRSHTFRCSGTSILQPDGDLTSLYWNYDLDYEIKSFDTP